MMEIEEKYQRPVTIITTETGIQWTLRKGQVFRISRETEIVMNVNQLIPYRLYRKNEEL